MAKFDKKRFRRKIKRKLRFTLGAKALTAMLIMAAAFTAFSTIAIRVIFFLIKTNDEVLDMYNIGTTSLGLIGTTNSEKACDQIKDMYLSIPEELRDDPGNNEYRQMFSGINRDYEEDSDDNERDHIGHEQNEIDDRLIHFVFNVIRENNEGVEDVGLCLLDEEKNRIVYVRSLSDIECGFWEKIDLKEYISLSTEDFIPKYSMEFEKQPDQYTWVHYRILIPIENDDTGNLNGYMYIKLTDYKLGLYEFVFAVIYLIFFAFIAVPIIFIISLAMNRMIIKPINKLSDAADDFTASGGIQEEKYYFRELKIKSNDEVRDLSVAMESMECKLHEYIKDLEKETTERLRMSSELEVAARIQANMLPEKLDGKDRSFGIYPFMRPARGVGGDFYDFFMIGEDKVGIVMADVSDKGLPASLFMVVSRTIIKNETSEHSDDLEYAVKKANRKLCENNNEMMFVTAFIAIYDIPTGTLKYVNAGHEDIILYEKDMNVYRAIREDHDVMLGVFEDAGFIERQISLKHGDKLFLYTDGVTEAMDVSENQFGMERLLKAINKNTVLSGDEMLENLWKEISQFQTETNQSDDVTMLLFEA